MRNLDRITGVVRLVGLYVLAAVLGGVVGWLLHPAPRTEPVSGIDPLRKPAGQYAWTDQPPPAFPIPPYAGFLKGVSIVLDPGHGGRADRKNWKCGPTGLREAEINLNVARALRDFLADAGAEVVLTRDADVYLDRDMSADLRKRIELANDLRANLFLSIHHNGVDNAPRANYTAVFYHGAPDHSPASLDAARHLLAGLNDALRLEQHLGCGLVSDFAVVPKKGFAVLRLAEVPAVLTEASFFTNPTEEARLRTPLYNRREAYGLFLGLARWAQAGLPRVRVVKPEDGRVRPGEPVIIALDDGLSARGGFGLNLPQFQPDSLIVEFAGESVPCVLNTRDRQISISDLPADLVARGGRLRVDFVNTFGQHVLHPWIELHPGR